MVADSPENSTTEDSQGSDTNLPPQRAQSASTRRVRCLKDRPLSAAAAAGLPFRTKDIVSSSFPSEYSVFFGTNSDSLYTPSSSLTGPIFRGGPVIPSYIPRSYTPSATHYSPDFDSTTPKTKTPFIRSGSKSRTQWIDTRSTSPGPGHYASSQQNGPFMTFARSKRASAYIQHPTIATLALDTPILRAPPSCGHSDATAESSSNQMAKKRSNGASCIIGTGPRITITGGGQKPILIDQQPVINEHRPLFCRILTALHAPNNNDVMSIDAEQIGYHPPLGYTCKFKPLSKNVSIRRRHGRAIEAAVCTPTDDNMRK